MNYSFDVIYFEFNSPLHISNARSDYGQSERMLHSDMLYAALMQTWAILGKTEWIQKTPPFALSSLYPFTLNNFGKKVHFFPKPFFSALTDKSKEQSEDAKKFKKVKYVDLSHFEQYLNHTLITSTTDSVKGSYQTNEKIEKNFLTADVTPRIKRPRIDIEDAIPFYTEKLLFRKGSGMYCLVQYDTEEAKYQVEVALNLLAENGIGTDRSVGNGRFSFTRGKLSIQLPESAAWAMNVSLFCPESKEDLSNMLSDNQVRYEIIKRGGWLSEPYNTYRKRSVYMFREGSLFKKQTTNVFTEGNSIDLKPDNALLPTKVANPVWRVGKALFLPVKL
jgi:CRISPR-associated protein Csm4